MLDRPTTKRVRLSQLLKDLQLILNHKTKDTYKTPSENLKSHKSDMVQLFGISKIQPTY
jgi:hypothetical protein